MPDEHTVIDAEQHYHHRMGVFAAETVTPGAIVLVGSSHLEWFDTGRFLPGRRFVNRAIASDRLGTGTYPRTCGTGFQPVIPPARCRCHRDCGTASTERGILHRLDVSVFDVQPAFIVFNNGVNDLGELWRSGEPALEEIFAAYERAIAAIREGTPGVPMLIVNELPTTGRFAGINATIPALNAHILRVAERHGCAHLDFHSEVVGAGGELRAELTYDGLHLNDAGYELFAKRLETHLPPIDP